MTRPGMSDARAFTTYISNGMLNKNIQTNYKVNSGQAYRTFLQTNSKNIMKDMKDLAHADVGIALKKE